MKSVVVEDDPVMRALLQARLRSRGHDVIPFDTAEDAWPLLEQEMIPLVVLDWVLPGPTDGLELCRRLRSLPHGGYSYVLVITGRSERSALTEVLNAGADDYLAKPVSNDVLMVRLTVAERGARGRMAQSRAEVARRDAENRLASVLWSSPLAAFVADESGRILSGEGRLARTLALGERPVTSVLELGQGRMVQSDDIRRAHRGETVARNVNLGAQDVEFRLTSLPAESPTEGARLGLVVHDITSTMQHVRRSEDFALETRAHLERYESVIDAMNAAILVVDSAGRIEHASPRFRPLLRGEESSFSRRRWVELVELPLDLPLRLEEMRQAPPEAREPIECTLDTEGITARALRLQWLDLPHQDLQMLLASDMSELDALRRHASEHDQRHGLVARSPAMQRALRQIDGLAPSVRPVLLEYERGDSPELFARMIHERGPRAAGPLHTLACDALGEAELRDRLFSPGGTLEACAGGTLVLADIGRTTRPLQLELLWLLEESSFRRPGQNDKIEIDVRFIFTSTDRLEQRVADGAFHGDLLQRLREMRLAIPPLRDRKEDMPLLVERLLRDAAAILGRPTVTLSPEALRVLCTWTWPGNLDELHAVLHHAITHARSRCIESTDLPGPLRDEGSVSDLDERVRILETLRRTKGNRKLAAKELGISRATFYRRLVSLGLKDELDRGSH